MRRAVDAAQMRRRDGGGGGPRARATRGGRYATAGWLDDWQGHADFRSVCRAPPEPALTGEDARARACKCARRPVGIVGLHCTHRNVHGYLRHRHADAGMHKGRAASKIKLVYLQGGRQVCSQQRQIGDKYI